MHNIIFSVATDTVEWNKLSIRAWQHSFEYIVVQEKSGRKAEPIVMSKNGKIIGYFIVVTYTLFKNKTICYLPYGPVFTREPTEETYESLRSFLRMYGKKQGAICVRAELPIRARGFFKTPLFAYRTSFHQARGEAVMDLRDVDFEYLRGSFSKSTKRNIQKAKKNNLEYQVYSGADMFSQLETYVTVNEQNTRDHDTTTHTKEYFTYLFETLSANKNNFVVTTSHQNIPLAINIYTVFNNRAYCPFGASTTQGKQMGAYYGIKQHAITHMLGLGLVEFNWGGIAVGKNDVNLSGLNSFKLGWGTQKKHHDDFYDVILSPWYWIYLGYTLVKKLR